MKPIKLQLGIVNKSNLIRIAITEYMVKYKEYYKV